MSNQKPEISIQASSRTGLLLAERRQHESAIRTLKDRIDDINRQITTIEGPCPLCRNWHYPHCNDLI